MSDSEAAERIRVIPGAGKISARSAARAPAHPGVSVRSVVDAGGLVVLWIFIIVAAVRLFSAMAREQRFRQEDFAVYYFAAHAMRQDHNPYTANIAQLARVNGADTHDISRTSDPPTFLTFFEPLAALPIQSAYWIWQGINFLCLAVAICILVGINRALEPALAAVIVGLALLYPPVGAHFWMGQSKLPVLLLLVITMRWMSCGREASAGLALALAALLRIFPLALIAYLVLQERRRIAAWAILGLMTGGTITIVLMGARNTESFIRSLSFLTGHWWEHDISLRYFVALAVWTIYPDPTFISKIARCALTGIIDVAVLAMTVKATLMFGNREDPDWRVFSLWLATSIFLLPVAWDYDLTLMLIPFVQLACAAARGAASRRALLMAAVSYALMLVWELVVGRVPPPGALAQLTVGEGGFFAMAAAYVAAYWFVVDARGAGKCSIREVPAQLWRRVVPLVTFGLA